MNNENTRREGGAPPAVLSELEKQVSELQKQVTDFAAQRMAISEVLRAIASSPHDLQSIEIETPTSTAGIRPRRLPGVARFPP